MRNIVRTIFAVAAATAMALTALLAFSGQGGRQTEVEPMTFSHPAQNGETTADRRLSGGEHTEIATFALG